MVDETVATPEVETAETQAVETPEVETPEVETPAPEAKTVPLAALHEERQRRRELQAQLMNQSQQYRTLEERLNFIAAKAAQADEPKAPDIAQDPLGKLDYTQQKIQAQLDQLTQGLTKQQQEANQRVQQEQVVTMVRQADAEFKARQPDSHEALGFLRARKYAEYVAAGATDVQARGRVDQDEWQLCFNSLQQGVNPAERAYEIAKAAGYVPPNDKLAMQQKGQQTSTPSGGGGRGGGKLSLDALLKMDSADFAKATEGNNWRKLVGG